MRILITGNQMNELNGQPLSCYENAKELAKKHDVSMICRPGRWGELLKNKLEQVGVKCVYVPEPEYDLIIASEWKPEVKGIVINTVRSEYDCETPIPSCDFYVGIRPSIVEHIIASHNIPKEKTAVVYNGIDRERFYPRPKKLCEHTKIVAPCTIDQLRQKFLNHIIGELNPEKHLYIYGQQFVELDESPFAHIFPSRFDIETVIADADLVVGIHLGRVNLEARSCEVPSLIYNPETMETTEFNLDEEEFDKRHNIKNSVQNLLNIYEGLRNNTPLHIY